MTNAWSEWHRLAEILLISWFDYEPFLFMDGWRIPHTSPWFVGFSISIFFLHKFEKSQIHCEWNTFEWFECSNYNWNDFETHKTCLLVPPDGANASLENLYLFEANFRIVMIIPIELPKQSKCFIQYRLIFVDLSATISSIYFILVTSYALGCLSLQKIHRLILKTDKRSNRHGKALSTNQSFNYILLILEDKVFDGLFLY